MQKKDVLRRPIPLFLRVTESEKEAVRKKAKAFGLTMDEYARCKIFDIPFDHINGRIKEKHSQPSHSDVNEATKATA